jgi:hypothetical protein
MEGPLVRGGRAEVKICLVKNEPAFDGESVTAPPAAARYGPGPYRRSKGVIFDTPRMTRALLSLRSRFRARSPDELLTI